MKTVFKFMALLIAFAGSAQIQGAQDYRASTSWDWDIPRQLIDGEYDFRLLDKQGTDGKINYDKANQAYSEMMRLFEANGITPKNPVVLSSRKKINLTREGILKEVRMGASEIRIRYDFVDGYYMYLNLLDESQGCRITKVLEE